ncbi:MAG: hypothetical protein J6567_10425 [Gilliamella sp.]|uniref:DUF7710 domain-containing protein n=1 Tax=Gilliamella sp. TaxID=1891236 RepID=UPI0026004D3F|nr:hypothetical protein [Gilliamella sp.]MCO6538359.1 hypothetical protein [Gilliamella sp.]MCO6550512.1 hypothetical protein [Gilliamella sp.]
MKEYSWVWVFKRDNISMVSAVFSSLEKADNWVKLNKLTGVLTKMPIDIGGYDWCIQNNAQMLEHYHYQEGIR